MFLLGVLCAFRRDADDFRPMARCFKCFYYKKFLRLMDEEDERVMDGIDRLHEIRERWERGEITEEEFRKQYDMIDRQMDGESVS